MTSCWRVTAPRFYALLGSNFVGGNLDVCKEMLLDANTITGLSDAGAQST